MRAAAQFRVVPYSQSDEAEFTGVNSAPGLTDKASYWLSLLNINVIAQNIVIAR